MAKFVGVSPKMLNQTKSHSFKGEYKYKKLIKIEQDFLENKVEKHCSFLMKEYFGNLSYESINKI